MKFIIALTLLIASYSAQAGCRINLSVQNTSNSTVRVNNDYFLNESSVRNPAGSWRALEKGKWHDGQYQLILNPGVKKSDVYQAAFKCNKKRRYRIAYKCGQNGNRTKYYPSSTGWTKRTDVKIFLNCP